MLASCNYRKCAILGVVFFLICFAKWLRFVKICKNLHFENCSQISSKVPMHRRFAHVFVKVCNFNAFWVFSKGLSHTQYCLFIEAAGHSA